jgi:hypothetical protein
MEVLKIKEKVDHLIFTFCCMPNTFFMNIFPAVKVFSHIRNSVVLSNCTKPTSFSEFNLLFTSHMLTVLDSYFYMNPTLHLSSFLIITVWIGNAIVSQYVKTLCLHAFKMRAFLPWQVEISFSSVPFLVLQ